MTQVEFEDLVIAAGLNLLSTWSPRFIVSLHVPTMYGTRRQTAVITFGTVQGFEAAASDETQVAITEIKRRLVKASKTKQGDIAQGGEVSVQVKQVAVNTGISYPAH